MNFTQEDFRVIIAFAYRFWSFFDDKGRQNIDELMLNDRYLKQSTLNYVNFVDFFFTE